MNEYISKKELYEQIAEREELARKRVLDTPSSLPYTHNNNPAYTRYSAQLCERTAFKNIVEDFKPADVIPVIRCKDCEYHFNDSLGTETCRKGQHFRDADTFFCGYGKRNEEKR